MDFSYSPQVEKLRRQLRDFMDDHVLLRVRDYQLAVDKDCWPPPFFDELKALARSEGLWNLFLPSLSNDEPGTRLSNLEYAPLAEIMGRIEWASEVFNCNAPDTGNMELLHMFGTAEQKQRWLMPLLNGEIRSCFAMSEPDVASSDATNIQTAIRREGADYIVNGRKWFITGAADPRCRISILLGVTDPNGELHKRHSMILIPMDSPGVEVARNISVMNHVEPRGHCEVLFRNVRVPSSFLLGEEGSGFALAQARLGPGRIHHCMRSIGQCELALELMCERAMERKTFGRYLHEHGSIAEGIALSRMEIEQARLLVLRAAWMIDNFGNKAARKEVGMIKAVVPSLQTRILDRAMQVFGAMGLSPDSPLANLWTLGRVLRVADGPDEVHLRTLARLEIKEAREKFGRTQSYLSPPER
jgi:acyl-CoA dehydrogenase